ncbi:MAG TPA: ATP-binding protein [Ramlibacter sp.]
MQALAARWSRLVQPSLQLRTALWVLGAFVLVFAVLVGYGYVQMRQVIAGNASGLQRYTEALLQSIEGLDDSHARAAIEVTASWTAVRRRQIGQLPGRTGHVLRGADGREVYTDPDLRGADLGSGPGMRRLDVAGVHYRVYELHSPQWRLQVTEPWRTVPQFVASNTGFILPYLLLAFPFVLVPVWLSVRNGLRPLQQLADGVAQRSPDELRPIGMPVRHRELKPLAQGLDGLFMRLRAKIERERAFVQEAAHELRTPLAVVGAQADVLARSPDPQQRAEAHVHLTQAIARASHLARQLLVLASLDELRAPALRRIDVAQAVRQLLAQAAPAALAKGMELSLEAADALWCEVDERALESIVFNLVDNAVRYGHAGGSIAVRLVLEAGELRLDVRDDGPGIPAAEHGRVFERFWRGAGHDAPGSGLGLAIVQQAALRMNGSAMLTSGLGAAGVGFLVRVPTACAG